MERRVSLKNLHDRGITMLSFGGEIICNDGAYELYNETGVLILCDGEIVDFGSWAQKSDGTNYIVGRTLKNKGLYITEKEYNIAVFESN